MNLDTNFISINGVLSEKIKDYHILSSNRRSGKKNVIRVWGLEDGIRIDKRVNIIGELISKPLWPGSEKRVLGVQAKAVFFVDDDKENKTISSVRFTGKVISKSSLRVTPVTENLILDLVLDVEGIIVPVVVWNKLADIGDIQYQIGDILQVEGCLNSREYQKMTAERVTTQLTTEVNAHIIKKL